MAYIALVWFDWDPAKDDANHRKHGLGFDEAKELFLSGKPYLEAFDEGHSGTEDRFQAIGEIHRGIIVVVWTERSGDVIRIISARFATKHEIERFRSYLEHHHE